MTKVLFITDKFMVAGTETFIMNVVRASDKDCFHYDFLIFYEGMNAYIEEAEARVSFPSSQVASRIADTILQATQQLFL